MAVQLAADLMAVQVVLAVAAAVAAVPQVLEAEQAQENLEMKTARFILAAAVVAAMPITTVEWAHTAVLAAVMAVKALLVVAQYRMERQLLVQVVLVAVVLAVAQMAIQILAVAAVAVILSMARSVQVVLVAVAS